MKLALTKSYRWMLLFIGVAVFAAGAFFLLRFIRDLDRDGLPDDWERRYFGDLNQSGTGDPDGDGLSSASEFAIGTNPSLADTDADGMPDKWEANHGLNPLSNDANMDLDFDTHHNLTEFLHGTDPSDHYDGKRPNIPPPQPTIATARVANGHLRVEWNDLSVSETAFAIYKRVTRNGGVTFELLGKETPAATLFERPVARGEVKEDDQVVVIAEPSSLPPASFVAAIVNQPFMLECDEAKQTFKVVATPGE